MSNSESARYRARGNQCYRSACEAGLSPCLQKCRFQEAISWYEKAKSSGSKHDEICSASKNIATSCKKIALLLGSRYESAKERHFYFKESLENFDKAYRFGNCKTHDWIDNLLMTYTETVQQAINNVENVEFREKIISLNQYAQSINNAKNLRAELYLEIALLHFREGVSAMTKNDYKKCLYERHECHHPTEEAKKFQIDSESYIERELRVLEDDITTYISMAESCQARTRGKKYFF